LKDLLYAPIAPSPPATLERRIHRMEHDRVGEPLRVQRSGVTLAGQADPLASTEDHEENDMPKGQYDRTKAKPRAKKGEKTEAAGGEGAGATAAVAERRPRKNAKKRGKANKKPRAARAPRSNGSAARFGVFSDGSVQIDAPGCKGNLGGDDVRLLVDFVKKLEG
jgi:hypothetical protein